MHRQLLPSPVSEPQMLTPTPSLSALCSHSVYGVWLPVAAVELSVWLVQPLLQGLLYLYLPRLFAYYHCCVVSPPYPAAHHPLWLAVENSIVRSCMQFSSRIDQLQMLPRGRHFGSRMFEVRQQAGHHVDDHLEP